MNLWWRGQVEKVGEEGVQLEATVEFTVDGETLLQGTDVGMEIKGAEVEAEEVRAGVTIEV